MDPLKQGGTPKETQLKFAKVHCPKMKSVYWTYFGFPMNDSNELITKQSVVCTLCHKVLTNHGNTTNLRAHLQHRHKDVFVSICNENGIRIPPRKTTPKSAKVKVDRKAKKQPLLQSRKIKIEYEADNSNNDLCVDEQTVLYETMVPMTYDDDEDIDTDNFTKVEVGNNDELRNNEMDIDMEQATVTHHNKAVGHKVALNYIMPSIIADDKEISNFLLHEALVNTIVVDVRNTDAIYDPGFSHLLRTLNNKIKIPSISKVESLIREQHSDKFTTLADSFKMHSKDKFFSLGFDVWTNINHQIYLSIFFNYTSEAPEYTLINQLYYTAEYNKYTSIETIFEDFNMKNCTAAIVNYDDEDFLKQYLQSKNIPIILAFDCTVDKCLRNVFSLPQVHQVIEDVKEIIMQYSQEIISKDVEMPALLEDFPWTYYDYLKFFTEALSWPEDMEVLVASAKTIVDTLSILSVTLDTLKSEKIPHSSLLSPITKKIISKKLNSSADDDVNATHIKDIITVVLKKFVMDDDHLIIAALLDPRFHRLTNSDINNCLEIIAEKCTRLPLPIDDDDDDDNTKVASPSPKKNLKPTTSSSRKSNLEMFFDIQDTIEKKDVNKETGSVDMEFKRYHKEVYCNLDDSPYHWWQKMGYLYPRLKYLAEQYQCVPCVVNMSFKKPIKDQIKEFRLRHMLSGNLIDAILFLHNLK